jgi:hypothetical protein
MRSALFAGVLLVTIVGCDLPQPNKPVPPPITTVEPPKTPENGVNTLFVGQIVKHKLSGRRGQVIEVYPQEQKVDVRFVNEPPHPGETGPPVIIMNAFEVVKMFGFEVEVEKR